MPFISSLLSGAPKPMPPQEYLPWALEGLGVPAAHPSQAAPVPRGRQDVSHEGAPRWAVCRGSCLTSWGLLSEAAGLRAGPPTPSSSRRRSGALDWPVPSAGLASHPGPHQREPAVRKARHVEPASLRATVRSRRAHVTPQVTAHRPHLPSRPGALQASGRQMRPPCSPTHEARTHLPRSGLGTGKK